MRRCAAVLLTMAASTLPMSGQRGGARAGSAGGVRVQGSASRAVSSGAISARVGGSGVGISRFAGGAPVSRVGGARNGDSRKGSFVSDRYRLRYGGYGTSGPLIFPVWSGWNGWTDPGLGYDAVGYGDGVAGTGQGGVPDDGQALGPGPYPAPYPVGPVYPAAAPVTRAAVAPEPEEAVTLVFRDGRATEQIHNYALTRTRLMVLDGRPREISLEQLDLAATERVNRAAGVEFKVPEGR